MRQSQSKSSETVQKCPKHPGASGLLQLLASGPDSLNSQVFEKIHRIRSSGISLCCKEVLSWFSQGVTWTTWPLTRWWLVCGRSSLSRSFLQTSTQITPNQSFLTPSHSRPPGFGRELPAGSHLHMPLTTLPLHGYASHPCRALPVQKLRKRPVPSATLEIQSDTKQRKQLIPQFPKSSSASRWPLSLATRHH